MSLAHPWVLLVGLLIPAVWLAGELLRHRLRGGVGYSPPPGFSGVPSLRA